MFFWDECIKYHQYGSIWRVSFCPMNLQNKEKISYMRSQLNAPSAAPVGNNDANPFSNSNATLANNQSRSNPPFNQARFPVTNPYVNALLWGGNRWNLNATRKITYSFWQPGSEVFDQGGEEEPVSTVFLWESPEIAAIETALERWSDVANISFVRTTDSNAAATLGFYSLPAVELGDINTLGEAGPPGESSAGIVYLNRERGPNNDWSFGLKPGGDVFVTMMHEIGHALGLAHPHDDGGGSSVFPGVVLYEDQDPGDYNLNQGIWTVMSYNDQWQDLIREEDDSAYGWNATPMAFDIAAIQHLYGRNNRYRTGDDTYTLPTRNRQPTAYSCIWDAGGVDTLKTGAREDTTIDLRPAPLVGANAGGYISRVNGIYGGFTIAKGVTIENAESGWGNDVLMGNGAKNALSSGEGSDVLMGGKGNDTLTGGEDADTLTGGEGNDLLVGHSFSKQDDFDVLEGGTGKDTFVLGRGDGYARIQDWNATDDLIQIKGIASQYRLQRSSNVIGGLSPDTQILFRGGQEDDIVGIVQDSVDVRITKHFKFV